MEIGKDWYGALEARGGRDGAQEGVGGGTCIKAEAKKTFKRAKDVARKAREEWDWVHRDSNARNPWRSC